MRNKLGVLIIIILNISLVLLVKGLIGSIKNCYTHAKLNNKENKIVDLYKLEIQEVNGLNYYLYSPNNIKDNLSLIIYLADSNISLENDNFLKLLSDGYYKDIPAYVVVIKYDNDLRNKYNDITDIINYMYNNYSIDINKISLTGYNSGGTLVYQLQSKLPNTFACILPINGDIQDGLVNINKLNNTSVWAHISSSDVATESLTSNFKITKYDDNMNLVYKNKDIINWLINCR